jgi:hypothetical protein
VPCNVQLLVVCVGRELDHFIPIEERWRDGIEHVGHTNKKDLRKIDQDVDVVILSIIIHIVSRVSTVRICQLDIH